MNDKEKGSVNQALPLFIAAVNDPDDGGAEKKVPVRSYAMNVISNMGPDAEAAARILWKLQETGDEKIRGEALAALVAVAPKDPKVIPLLIQTLNKEPRSLRHTAAHALGLLGPNAKEAVPALVDALKTADVADEKLSRQIKLAVIWCSGKSAPMPERQFPRCWSSFGSTPTRICAISRSNRCKKST